FLLGTFFEFLAGHGGAVNAVAAGLGADVNHRIALAGRARVEDLVFAHQAEREGIYQRITGVAFLEFCLAAQIGNAKTVPVRCNAADHSLENGVVLVQDLVLLFAVFRRRNTIHSAGWTELRSFAAAWLRGCDRPKSQRVHHRQGARSHGEDVAQDSAHAGRRALKWLDIGRVIVRFDFEGAGPAIADVDDAGVLSRPLNYPAAARRQPLQMDPGRFVGAVLAPHYAVDSQFGEGGLASQRLHDALVLFRCNAVRLQQFRGRPARDGSVQRFCSHGEALFSHAFARGLGRQFAGFIITGRFAVKYNSDMARRDSQRRLTSTSKSTPTIRGQKNRPSAAAQKIASLIEEHMSEKGWTEQEKKRRITSFSRRVDALRARPSGLL